MKIIELKQPENIPSTHELKPNGVNKTLVIIDDCTIINYVNFTQLFLYGRPLNINTIYLF